MTTNTIQPATGATPEPKRDEPSNWVHRMVSPRWPRGRYNSKRITGFRLHFSMRTDAYTWWPVIRWNYANPIAAWLIVRVDAEAVYHYHD